jgi:hypothetical protein
MKFNKIVGYKFIILGLFVFFTTQAFCLVDYSEVEDNKTINKSQNTFNKIESKSSLVWKSNISLDTNYELLKMNNQDIGLLNTSLHFQTPVNIFFDADYWHANGEKNSSSGNTKLKLGLNWIKIGNPSEEAQINLIGGVRLKSSSDLGSSRTDKIFGLETTKKFGSFGVGIGYEITLAGTPTNSLDLDIGNIHKIEFSTGWMASNEIQFEFCIENFRVASSTSNTRINKLNNDLNFSTVSPKINLELFKSINFELGARYSMKKAKSSDNLQAAKLVDLHGVYSNSVFTGINFNL